MRIGDLAVSVHAGIRGTAVAVQHRWVQASQFGGMILNSSGNVN